MVPWSTAAPHTLSIPHSQRSLSPLSWSRDALAYHASSASHDIRNSSHPSPWDTRPYMMGSPHSLLILQAPLSRAVLQPCSGTFLPVTDQAYPSHKAFGDLFPLFCLLLRYASGSFHQLPSLIFCVLPPFPLSSWSSLSSFANLKQLCIPDGPGIHYVATSLALNL